MPTFCSMVRRSSSSWISDASRQQATEQLRLAPPQKNEQYRRPSSALVRQRLQNRQLIQALGPKPRRRPGLVVRELNSGSVGEETQHHVQTPMHDGPRQRREAEEAVHGARRTPSLTPSHGAKGSAAPRAPVGRETLPGHVGLPASSAPAPPRSPTFTHDLWGARRFFGARGTAIRSAGAQPLCSERQRGAAEVARRFENWYRALARARRAL